VTRRIVFMLAALALAAPAATARSTDQNRAAAFAEADALLAAAALPADATPLAGEPEGDGGVLANPAIGVGNPNVAVRTSWFRSPGTVADVLAYTDAHPPSGAVLRISGGGETRDGHRAELRAYERHRVRNALGNRWLLVSATKLDDSSTGIRVDGYVVWLDARPEAEVIPASARHLTITARGRHTIRITDAARVQRIATMLNQADVVQPDLRLCERARAGVPEPRLTFRARRAGQPLAIVRVHPAGCPTADVRIGDRRMPTLDLLFEPQLLKALKKLSAY
jgi:hypothetical protein